ncbi:MULTISPECIES: hypothetical protein [Nitrosomonas]|uniref:Uncharacterized protein n=1 Tax=Nitrosomonas oligotropha TaxID=42354 RepID=A0A1H8PDL5_9PROT|nr:MULTISPECIES: hypothetical protein [Nitrosomonas]SDW77211.1 hypothetical protein SAMN05216300_11052 [Nitrosomonas oligotropha]SEO39891.1 hypothetical protein SAMN05216333_10952 [Nitrosomonas oligotropha]
MCGDIEYQDQKIYFPQPGAWLLVCLRDGSVTWIAWGRCKDEAISKFPNGSWARLNSIKSGKWKPWHPRPVLIAADQFMEKDHDNQSHWVSLDTRIAIQGLLAERDNECGFMWVIINTPPEYAWIQHDCWPRLVRLTVFSALQ